MTATRPPVCPGPHSAASRQAARGSAPDRRGFLALGLGVVGLGMLGLGGCAPILGTGAALDAYDLAAPADLPRASARSGLELVIEAPAVPGALASDRILIRPDPLRAQYLPGARWTQDAPEVLRTLFVHGFEATGGLRLATRRPLGSFADYRLSTEVIAFQIEATTPGMPAQAVLRLAARIVDDRGRSAPAARSFEARVAVTEPGTLGYVRALNAAAGQVMTRMAAWGLAQMGIPARQPNPQPTPQPNIQPNARPAAAG